MECSLQEALDANMGGRLDLDNLSRLEIIHDRLEDQLATIPEGTPAREAALRALDLTMLCMGQPEVLGGGWPVHADLLRPFLERLDDITH